MPTSAERRKQRLERFIRLYCCPETGTFKSELVCEWKKALGLYWWDFRHEGDCRVTAFVLMTPMWIHRQSLARRARLLFSKLTRIRLGLSEPTSCDFMINFND